MAGIVLQSLIVQPARIEMSYFDPDTEGPHGFEIRTAVIALNTGAVDSEVAELHEAALQLLTAWEGARRDVGPRVPAGR